MKRLIRKLLCIFLCAGMILSSCMPVIAESEDKPVQEMEVVVTNTSSDYGHGYYVEYTINGIPYRSDITGYRINQMAFTHMSDEDKKKTLYCFGFALKERESQFGGIFSGEMAQWYRDHSGLTEAQEILKDRLAKNNFPEYHERFSNGYSYFVLNFYPQSEGFYAYPELRRLFDEEKLVYSWAEEAYYAMERAQLVQTSIAVKSLSGDLIQLIVDRCLVPNITPSGAGGIAATINGTIMDYYMNIYGISDKIQDVVVGKRVRAAEARQAIDLMAEAIDFNKKIIQDCTKEAHRLQNLIDEKYPALAEKAAEEKAAIKAASEKQTNTVLEASPVKMAPDAEITKKNEWYNERLFYLVSQTDEYEKVKREKTSYNRQMVNEVISKQNDWNNTYYGGRDPANCTDDSVVGAYVKSYPEEPRPEYAEKSMPYIYSEKDDPYEALDLYMTEEQQSQLKKDVADYAGKMKTYWSTRARLREEFCEKAIAARNSCNKIASMRNAIDLEGLALSDEEKKQYYGASLDGVNECAGLESKYYYPWDISSSEGATAYAEAQAEYWDEGGEYLDGFQNDMKKLDQFQEDVKKEVKDYKALVEKYEDAYAEYEELNAERKKLLNDMPSYIRGAFNGDNSELADLCYEGNATAEDMERIAQETSELYEQYILFRTQTEMTAQDVVLYAEQLKDLNWDGTTLRRILDSGNKELTTGAEPWPDEEAVKVESIYSTWIDEYSGDAPALADLSWERMAALDSLEMLCRDFNGKTWAHERMMEIFGDLSDNKETYSQARSDEYERLKKEAQEMDPKENSYAAETGMQFSGAVNWPDPYKDLVEPLIRQIDKALESKEEYIDPDPKPEPDPEPKPDPDPDGNKVVKDLPAVSIKNVKAGKKAMTVSWKKVSAKKLKVIKKIQIQYSTNKKFKSGVKTVKSSPAASSKKITKLKKGKKYFVRIRAYAKSGDKEHVSGWSAKKAVKVK